MMKPRGTPQHKAVDAWIASDLMRRYEAILAEPVPAELLALLAE